MPECPPQTQPKFYRIKILRFEPEPEPEPEPKFQFRLTRPNLFSGWPGWTGRYPYNLYPELSLTLFVCLFYLNSYVVFGCVTSKFLESINLNNLTQLSISWIHYINTLSWQGPKHINICYGLKSYKCFDIISIFQLECYLIARNLFYEISKIIRF